MKIKVVRNVFSPHSTIGDLYINDKWICYTLEDVCRSVKIPNETAIPYGTYKVVIAPSKRFNRNMPRLLDVPNYEGVLIHYGNTDKDTEGCILVGLTKGRDFIGKSRDAFDLIYPLIEKAFYDQGVRLTISKEDDISIDIQDENNLRGCNASSNIQNPSNS